jgi:hypothetical protein
MNNLLNDKNYANNMEHYLTNYATENMKPFTVDILQQVIDDNLLKSRKTHLLSFR